MDPSSKKPQEIKKRTVSLPSLIFKPHIDLKPAPQTPLAESIMNQSSIVILSSISLPKNAALSPDEREQWKQIEKNKIIEFRKKLSIFNKVKNATITLAMEQSFTNDWWAGSLLQQSYIVIVLLNKAILDYIDSNDLPANNDDDRHTRIVGRSVHGMLMGGEPKHQVYILYKTDERDCNIKNVFPFILPMLLRINDDEQLSEFAKQMEKREFKHLGRNLIQRNFDQSVHIHANNLESYYIPYLKNIYIRNEMQKFEKSYVDIKLFRIKSTDFDKENTRVDDDNLGNVMTNKLFNLDTESFLGKKILIQGLAGSGKTVLSQVFLCRWGLEKALKQFKMVFYIEINGSNYEREMIDLVQFIPYEKPEHKKELMSTISRSKNILIILDFVYFPSGSNVPVMRIFKHYTCTVLSLTRPLQNEFNNDSSKKQFIKLIDFNYSIKGFDMHQLMEFFHRRDCDFQAISRMQNEEIFSEICQLPIYAVIFCQSLQNSTNVPQKTKSQENTFTLLYKSLIEKIVSMHSKVDFSLDRFDEFPDIRDKFRCVCFIAWDLAYHHQSQGGELNPNLIQSYEDSLGLFEIINKNNKNHIYFSMQSVQYFLAAYTFVFINELPNVTNFLTPLKDTHYINSMWRFVVGLLRTPAEKNQVLISISQTYVLPKLMFIQAIAESGLRNDQVSEKLIQEINSWLSGTGKWTTRIYPSDGFAILKSFEYLPKYFRERAYNSIDTISFTQCDLESESMFHLIGHLSKLNNIKLLNFSRNESFGNPYTSKGCLGYLREIIRNNASRLTDIYLSKCGLTQHSMRMLKSTFCMLSSITLIDLSKNPEIGEDGWKIFSEVLPSITLLNKLHIAFNNISCANLELILLILTKSFDKLKLLNLSGNTINATTMQHIVKLLEVSPYLHRLYLSACDIGNDSLNILANLFQRESYASEALIALNLSNNAFDKQNLPPFIESLISIRRLQNLTLDNNSSIGSCTEKLCKLLSSHSQLKDLSISNCNIGDRGAMTISCIVDVTKATVNMKRNPEITQSNSLAKSIIC